jgi:hypothetical protein
MPTATGVSPEILRGDRPSPPGGGQQKQSHGSMRQIVGETCGRSATDAAGLVGRTCRMPFAPSEGASLGCPTA